jgi:hypothetical protein
MPQLIFTPYHVVAESARSLRRYRLRSVRFLEHWKSIETRFDGPQPSDAAMPVESVQGVVEFITAQQTSGTKIQSNVYQRRSTW